MKKSIITMLATLFVFCFCAQEIMARGMGMGGGRGMSMGGARGGGAAFRSPSMSQPSFDRGRHQIPSGSVNRQGSRSTSGAKKQVSSKQRTDARQIAREADRSRAAERLNKAETGRPTEAQLQHFLNLPQNQRPGRASDLAKIGTGASVGALGVEGARKLLEGQRAGLEKQFPRTGVAERRGEAGRLSALAERQVGNDVRNHWQNRRDKPFTPDWWREHPNAARAYWDHHHHPWNYWWRTATWAALIGWTAGVAAGSAYGEPIYYDYGENIYYDNEDVYVEGKKTATAEEYYNQANALADKAPEITNQENDDWMPLGVFALSRVDIPDSNMVLQLAINKQGVISGTYYNTQTDMSRPVKGMVDKTTQRAAWTFSDGKNTDIIMETGLYNLTQDQTEALVHFGKDKTQRWLMVRLNQPGEEKQADKRD